MPFYKLFIHLRMRFFWRYKLDHVIFWCITIIFYAYVTTDLLQRAGTYHYSLNIIMRNGLLAGICYANVYYLFPAFFKKNRYVFYALLVAACLLVYTLLKNAHDSWLYGYVLGDLQKRNFFYNTFYNFSVAVFYLSFTMALILSKNWYKQHLLLQRIQVENLQTELRYLKAQMNPHFLFNSINTIYFQIDKHNTEARTSLQKFSELLRYQLYECNEELIEIEKEVEYLKSYIDLQRLRRKKNYNIHFEAGEDVCNFSIAPLLLIPFVENAFKHISNHTDKDNYIRVKLQKQKECLLFDVVNSKNNNLPPGKERIGLKNVKRRLELLYAGRHELMIDNQSSVYSVHLKIQVS
jgi:two-component system LytT family sensor kinase